MNDLPIIAFETEADWTTWLDAYHTSSQGLWMKIAKKDSGHATISYQEALTVALCFGWIDGQKNKLDDAYWLQKFTPRRARSPWSRINREKAEQLIAQGQMRPAGLAEVERAQADGRWAAAYESQRVIEVPDDLQAALHENPAAQALFDRLNSANRYVVLYEITTAKKPETRQRRLEKFIAMLNAGKKPIGG
jgi:uncharacterized protein YdeI (YjbR/CyaY-like superfamily)